MRRPNIVFLLTDNQRADLVGCAGNGIIKTPNLDLLGHRGVRFANAFATTPVCAASRASYLTGLYERRHQFTFHTPPLRKEFCAISYPALLKAAGYHTGFIGKFGIAVNGIEPSLEDAGALEQMFDHFDNYEHSTDEGYEIRQPDGTIRHLTDITGDKAVAFIARHSAAAGARRPFCLSVSFNAPHAQDGDPRHYVWPKAEDGLYRDAVLPEPVNADPAFFAALPRFIRESESRVRWHTRFDSADNYQRHLKGLYRMVSGVDRNVGRIVAALQRHSLADDTVIIFASDHGMYYGERGLSDCWQLNEQPLRVPLIICDPRRAPGNWQRPELALNIDVAPTILELGGVPIPNLVQGTQPGTAVRGRPRARLALRVLLRAPVRTRRHPQERGPAHRGHQVPALLRTGSGVRRAVRPAHRPARVGQPRRGPAPRGTSGRDAPQVRPAVRGGGALAVGRFECSRQAVICVMVKPLFDQQGDDIRPSSLVSDAAVMMCLPVFINSTTNSARKSLRLNPWTMALRYFSISLRVLYSSLEMTPRNTAWPRT